MSEWGSIGFHYDYTGKGDRWHDGCQTVRGLVAKAYKYPGIPGMVMHMYNGMKFFLEHYTELPMDRWEKFYYDIDTGRISTAFDVFFELGEIDPGVSSIKSALKGAENSGFDIDEFNYALFGCEGTDGYVYITFTGNEADGYVMKYAVMLHGKSIDIRSYAARSFEYAGTGWRAEDVKDYLEKCVAYIEENARQMDEKEIEDFLNADYLDVAKEMNE